MASKSNDIWAIKFDWSCGLKTKTDLTSLVLMDD